MKTAVMKQKDNLVLAAARVIASHFCSAEAFVRAHKQTIKDYNFKPSNLILVCNTQVEKEMNRKHKDGYLRPMVVVSRHQSGLYTLAKLDRVVSKTVYGAFCIVPYYPRVTSLLVVEAGESSDEEYE